jgi:hypothetical protein
MMPSVLPAIDRPIARPRSSSAYKSAIKAYPTTHVTASAAPCSMRAKNSIGIERAYANASVDTASKASAPIIGRFRPKRSDSAPIGTATVSSVIPNDPKSRPIVVGVA